jgi:hypothetical protein
MQQAKPTVQQAKSPLPAWAQMTRAQKVTYVAKVVVSVLTFGFVFPGD